MAIRRIELKGPGTQGTVVNAALLRDLLNVVIEGSQRAVRIRTQGRSTARGAVPRWIEAASRFTVQILEGSTVLQIEAPTLFEADPEEFAQRDAFPEIDPDLTSFDYFADTLDAALGGEERSALYDRAMLRLLNGFGAVFEHGIESLVVEAKPRKRKKRVHLVREDLSAFSRLEKQIPPPQQAKVAGDLDLIRHSDRTFSLTLPTGDTVKGITDSEHLGNLQSLWGQSVVVAGTAHFTASGTVLRIEADRIAAASDRDTQLWALVPEPVFRSVPPAAYRVRQGSRSGVNAVLGQWPGDESDDEIAEALERLS